MVALHDMHCHLDFMTNGETVAREALLADTLLFANTVTPESWLATRDRFSEFGNVIVGFGMHPWWVSGTVDDSSIENGKRLAESQRAEHRRLAHEAEAAIPVHDQRAQKRRKEVARLLEEHDPTFIGEIGLDFGWRHQASKNTQLEMFEAIARWAASRQGKLISLHSIKAARETLDILEASGALASCTCLFHWFSGSSDLLKRAIDAGCYFSCGVRMLATGKGREYVKAIPANRLLLETDAPPERDTAYSFAAMQADLESVAQSIASIKGKAALETIEQTARELLGRR